MSLGRALFVGGLKPGGNGPDWARAIALQGAEVIRFDTKRYAAQGGRLERALSRRTGLSRHIAQLNADLCRFADAQPFDWAFVTKGVHLYAQTVRHLRGRAKQGQILHLTIDSMFTDNRSRHFFKAIPEYSAVMTDKGFEHAAYRDHGAGQVIPFTQPYGLRFDDLGAVAAARSTVPDSDVCFVGHCQPHYARALRAVAALGIDLKIWGPGWTEHARSNAWARAHVQSDGLWGAAYPAALSRAKIGLGLLSKRIPEQATTRSVEIPAAGALLLAERTAGHRALFREGHEAVFFSDLSEMTAKITDVLSDDKARRAIAAAGKARAQAQYAMPATVHRLLHDAGVTPILEGAA